MECGCVPARHPDSDTTECKREKLIRLGGEIERARSALEKIHVEFERSISSEREKLEQLEKEFDRLMEIRRNADS